MGDASMYMQDGQIPQGSMDNNTLDPQMNNQPNYSDDEMENIENIDGNNMNNTDNIGSIERTKKNIQKNIGKACSDFRGYQGKDKEDLGKWISGMLDSLDGDDDDDDDVDFDDSDENEDMPMEGVYSKKELEALNEVFGDLDSSNDETLNTKKKIKNTKSPFNNPNFN